MKKTHTTGGNQMALSDVLFQNAYLAHQNGRLAEAQALYRRALQSQPQHAQALHMLGVSYAQQGNYQDAAVQIALAVQLTPTDFSMQNNLGNAYIKLGQYANALQALDNAIEIKPDSAQVWNNRGNALYGLENLVESLRSYEMAEQLDPHYTEAMCNKAHALLKMAQFGAAQAAVERALTIEHQSARALEIKGRALSCQSQHHMALLSYDMALSKRPDFAPAHFGKGVSLYNLYRPQEAIQEFERALSIDPGLFKVYPDLASALFKVNRFDDALATLDKAIAVGVQRQNILGARTLIKTKVCDWTGLKQQLQELLTAVIHGEQVTQPFHVLSVSDDLAVIRKVAETYVNTRCPENTDLPPLTKSAAKPRITLGYYSADFFHHATMRLMAEFFELHDKNKFEVIAFSYSPQTDDVMRKRLLAAVDQFVDINDQSDTEVARLSRNMDVDIAIDLKGLTGDCRLGIFAARAAPIQVNYLGYPGTLGASYMDYILADKVLIPDHLRNFYSEKVVQLPHTYQVNDRQRAVPENGLTRLSCGLPDDVFVYCCFNNSYKMTSDVFTIWMKILARVPDSVIWLFADNLKVEENLTSAAVSHGIDPKRLVFARRVNYDENMSRQCLADLFLDTMPYNAHTTASDALWAGLPVLTLQGQSFAARVASSLLHAVGLPELVTTNAHDYEELAVRLASNPATLLDIKTRLISARSSAPLFDTPLLTRNIEDAYQHMYQRYRQELLPEHFAVE